jgi:TusA-related sulfurtransferase
MSDTILENEIMEFHKELDARGLNCPLPILKAKKALAELQSGEVLRIMATDPVPCVISRLSANKPATPCCRTSRWAVSLSF